MSTARTAVQMEARGGDSNAADGSDPERGHSEPQDQPMASASTETPREAGNKRQRRAPGWLADSIVGELPDKVLTQLPPSSLHLTNRFGARPSYKSARRKVKPKIKITEKGGIVGPDPEPYEHEFPGGPIKVLSCRLIDGDRVEVEVKNAGRRYVGVMEKSGPPSNGTYIIEDCLRGHALATQPCVLCNLFLRKEPLHGADTKWHAKFVRVFVSNNWTALCHLQCALWAPEVYEDARGNLFNLAPAIRRGRALRCRHCKERGATLGCYTAGCQMVYHLPCAVDSGCSLEENTYQLYCPAHA